MAAGAIAVVASLLLPWYGIPFSRGLSVTGLDSFGFGARRAAGHRRGRVVLVAREAPGRRCRARCGRPSWSMAGGLWAALLPLT